VEWDDESREVLAAATFSVFAPDGLPVELCGWGGGDGDPVDMVGLRHESGEDRWIDVESEVDAGEVSPEDHLEVDAASETRPIRVDGVERPFEFASAGDRWVAIGTVGDVTITVQANGMDVEDLHLRALTGPAGYRPLRPDHGVLDPLRVEELADATLAGLARGAFALLESKSAESSWIGGEPHLPAGARWPSGVHGAMTFVLQLSLADLDPSVWTGPTSGHLHIFCDIEPDSNSIEGAGACAILHTPADAELSVRDLHHDNRLPRRMVEPRIGLTLPDEDAPVMRPLGLGFDELWTLKKRLHAEQGWKHPVGQLLGWPTWQNDDGMEHLASLRDGQDLKWTLLLQTDAVDAELYVVLPTADLAAGRFDRAEATIEHD
jgi:hypothetical protein